MLQHIPPRARSAAAVLLSVSGLQCGGDNANAPNLPDAGSPPDSTLPTDAAVDGSGSGDTAAPPIEGGDAPQDAKPLGDASPPPSTQIVVHFSDPQQTIDGFGAAEAFIPTITDAQADLFFSTTNGIGLSILRMGIAPTGAPYSGSWASAQKALARNPAVFVWGAPWSPPAADKTTGNTTTGTINASAYGSWASVLAGFVAAGRMNGVPVAAVSAQNEPDYNTNGAYDMCLYSASQMTSFVNALGPALAALSPKAKLIMPESSQWGNLWGGIDYADGVLADMTAGGYVDILATHQYGVTDPPMHTVPAGKRLWETEVSDIGSAFDPSIGNAVSVAARIHNAILHGSVNAWHYWWLVNQNPDNEGLIGKSGDGTLTKRVFAMGNFSRFVRPGWVRLGTTGTVTGLLVSAYANPPTGDFAVVAVNTTGGNVMATFGVAGPIVSSVTPYVTSGTPIGNVATDGNLSQGSTSASIPMTISVAMNAFAATLPPGVITFVGRGQ